MVEKLALQKKAYNPLDRIKDTASGLGIFAGSTAIVGSGGYLALQPVLRFNDLTENVSSRSEIANSLADQVPGVGFLNSVDTLLTGSADIAGFAGNAAEVLVGGGLALFFLLGIPAGLEIAKNALFGIKN